MTVVPAATLISVAGIARHDPATGSLLLKPTDFSLAAGDQVSIVGPSGSGKSVLLRLLALLDAPDAGQLAWHAAAVSEAAVPAYRRQVCYIAQRPALLDGTVEDNLRYPFSLKSYRGCVFDRQAALRMAEQVGRGADFLGKRSSELSGGEAQIAALIRVLQLNPEVILLDEPTAALDPESSREIETLITTWFTGNPGHAYVWISHDLEQARRMSTRRMRMQAGVLSEEAL